MFMKRYQHKSSIKWLFYTLIINNCSAGYLSFYSNTITWDFKVTDTTNFSEHMYANV